MSYGKEDVSLNCGSKDGTVAPIMPDVLLWVSEPKGADSPVRWLTAKVKYCLHPVYLNELIIGDHA